ncbi:MAG: DUF58 domain-containing protein [Acidimicrobiales bacterium]
MDLLRPVPARAGTTGLLLAPRALGYVVVAAGTLIAAVALQDAPLAGLGIPALVAVVFGLALDAAATESELTAEIRLDHQVVNVGSSVIVTILISSSRPVARCRAALVAERARVKLDKAPFWLFRLGRHVPVELRVTACFERPGQARIGPLDLFVSGAAGLFHRKVTLGQVVVVQVRPHEDSLASLPRSMRVRAPAGDRLARSLGEGIELAEVRPERAGERARRINWRATARYGTPHVTLRHPEQSTDVVLFADTFDDPATPRVLEAAAAAASGYLKRRDRVGLICFGGVIDWVEAGSGSRQLDRIRARLAATRPFFSYAWKTIERIPPRALPAGALVVAVTPLRDERATSAIAELRARGHEVIVVEVAEPARKPATGDPPSLEAAILLDAMEREDLRHRLWVRGIAVAPLFPGQPLEAVFASLSEVRRRMRPGARR